MWAGGEKKFANERYLGGGDFAISSLSFPHFSQAFPRNRLLSDVSFLSPARRTRRRRPGVLDVLSCFFHGGESIVAKPEGDYFSFYV